MKPAFFQRKRKRTRREDALLTQLTSGNLELFRRAPTGPYLFHTHGILAVELWTIVSSYLRETRSDLLGNLLEAFLSVAHPTSTEACKDTYRNAWKYTLDDMLTDNPIILFDPRDGYYELSQFVRRLWYRCREAHLGKEITIQLFRSLLQIAGFPPPVLDEWEKYKLMRIRFPHPSGGVNSYVCL